MNPNFIVIPKYENMQEDFPSESFVKNQAHVFFVEWLVLKFLSSCSKLWISFKMQIKLLLGGAEDERRGLCLTGLLTKEAVSCILHGF